MKVIACDQLLQGKIVKTSTFIIIGTKPNENIKRTG